MLSLHMMHCSYQAYLVEFCMDATRSTTKPPPLYSLTLPQRGRALSRAWDWYFQGLLRPSEALSLPEGPQDGP